MKAVPDRIREALPEFASPLERPVSCLVWVLEGALARGDFALADEASSELRDLGIELRLLPRGHDIAQRSVANEVAAKRLRGVVQGGRHA